MWDQWSSVGRKPRRTEVERCVGNIPPVLGRTAVIVLFPYWL